MQTWTLKSNKEYKRTSQFLGVNWHTKCKKWRAAISIHGTKKILGYFDDEVEAARAYNDAVVKYGKDSVNVLPVNSN